MTTFWNSHTEIGNQIPLSQVAPELCLLFQLSVATAVNTIVNIRKITMKLNS